MYEGDIREELEQLVSRGRGGNTRERLEMRPRVTALGFLLIYNALLRIADVLERTR